ncbi:MAG TPA: glycosyltransferase [Phycisphaerales bacterium]|nr:glycosyltransferase [Phycisphaerales bacterium]
MPPPASQPAATDTPHGSARVKSNIEVVIPAFNEEVNLPHALASVTGWADAVYVVDSESTDRTREIARESGAKVVVRPWLGYARQKNWALDNLPLSTDWVFILDADEAITPELRDEMLAIARRPAAEETVAGFYVNRLTHFMGAPIRHCGYYPSYNLRLFKRGKARYEEREVHEHMMVDGPTGRLRHDMLHEDRRGLEHFIAKHNRYSTLEARELQKTLKGQSGHELPSLERGIRLRRWLKRNVLPRLPFSGIWRFFYMYVLRLGVLDGAAGLRFCVLLAMYDTFISLKLAELRSIDGRAGAARPSGATPGAGRGGLAIPEGEVTPTGPAARDATAAPSAGTTPAARAAPALNGATHTPAPPARVAAVGHVLAEGRPTPDAARPEAAALREKLDPTRMPPGGFPPVASVPVSILVPVKNEQRNIVECLRRCQWATELVVVDSQSTDQTIALSQAMGADVYQFNYNRATGWPKKKNWALEMVPWKNEWVMILDADEYMTPELAQEIKRVVEGSWRPEGKFAQAGCGDGYWVNRRFMFFGRWIRGCGYYPSWNVRLLKHRLGRYERIGTLGDTGSGDNEVHEHIVLSSGKAGYLSNEFLHYAYPDLSAWIEKHNRYTTWEAHAMEAKDKGAVRAKMFGEPIERRRWLKSVARRLPFRPTLRFVYAYFAQRGFLDGYAGFVMCRLLAWYEFMSIAKYREMLALRSDDARREAERTSGRPM